MCYGPLDPDTPRVYLEGDQMAEIASRSYSVDGMSCEHCRAAVSDALAAIEGVDEVAVDLAAGRVEIRGRDLSDEAVQAAVEGAGYELGPRR